MKILVLHTENVDPTSFVERLEKLGHKATLEEFSGVEAVVLYPDARNTVDYAQLLDRVFSQRIQQPIPMLIVRHVSDRSQAFVCMYPILGVLDETCSDELLNQKLRETGLLREE